MRVLKINDLPEQPMDTATPIADVDGRIAIEDGDRFWKIVLTPDDGGEEIVYEKLSKRHGAVSVMEYPAQGYLPEAMLNYLARLGWSHGDDEIFTREQLEALKEAEGGVSGAEHEIVRGLAVLAERG